MISPHPKTTLALIFKQWEKDCQINETELSKESLRSPYLHSKYLSKFGNERLILKTAYIQRKKHYNNLRAYYKGELNNKDDLPKGKEPWKKKVLTAELKEYIEADPEMIELDTLIGYQQEVVDALDSILKAIARRGFDIRAAVDFLKFTNGN